MDKSWQASGEDIEKRASTVNTSLTVGQDNLASRLNLDCKTPASSMTDRFVLNHRKGASKAEQKPPPEGGNAIMRTKPTKHQLLHDHRSSDPLLEYLDDLEE